MPRKYNNPDRRPGKYRCYLCKVTHDSADFYRDRARWNGCGSRCKTCDDLRSAARRDPTAQSFTATPDAPRTQKAGGYKKHDKKIREDARLSSVFERCKFAGIEEYAELGHSLEKLCKLVDATEAEIQEYLSVHQPNSNCTD